MWYDGCEHYGGVGVSEKVLRTTIVDAGGGFLDVSHSFTDAFCAGDAVVVIPASVYDFLKQTEALAANGVVLDVDEYKRLKRVDERRNRMAALIDECEDSDEPRKRCMNCDGNNVNAPCTCEGV